VRVRPPDRGGRDDRRVREQRALPLMDAIRKMSLMPADRLALKSKGRLAVGADADIAVEGDPVPAPEKPGRAGTLYAVLPPLFRLRYIQPPTSPEVDSGG